MIEIIGSYVHFYMRPKDRDFAIQSFRFWTIVASSKLYSFSHRFTFVGHQYFHFGKSITDRDSDPEIHFVDRIVLWNNKASLRQRAQYFFLGK